MLAKLLFGQSQGLEIVSIDLTDSGYQIHVKTGDDSARCTSCDTASKRVHSRYTRTLRDLAIAGQPLVLRVQVRRLRCENSHCSQRIFSESIGHVAARFQRVTARALAAERNIALALGGEAGSRLAFCLGLPVSGDSLLRRLANMPSPTASAPRVIGVDDWAIRRGQTYGTLICDLERKCPIAMLPNRSAETLTEWLKAHPEIEIISRDRAGEYAKAASDGAPQAIQVADRWHLLRNSTEALQKVIETRQKEINVAIANAATPMQATVPHQREESPAATESIQIIESMNLGRVSADKKAKYEAVIELSKGGHGQREISRRTGLNRKTVCKYLGLETYPVRKAPSKQTRVSRYAGQIHHLIESGVTNAAEIYRRLTTEGFSGSYHMVRRYLAKVRTVSPAILTKLKLRVELWSTRKTAWLLSSQTTELNAQDKERISAIAHACPEIKLAADLTNQFATMIRNRSKACFQSWITAATHPQVPRAIRNFANNLLRDQAAVEAALDQPWNNGQLEGQINRLKMLKRQMYGRANLKLLECRVLNAA